MMRRHGRAGILVASVALVAGCGGSSAPSDDVPELGDILDRVDEAIVAGEYDEARSALEGLVETTEVAREEGDLARDEADRILAAAAELGSVLPQAPADEPEPEPEPTTEPEPTESSEPAPEPTEEPTESEEESESEDDAEKEQEQLEKELEKEQREAEKEAEKAEGDNGQGSENGNGKS